MPPVPPNGRSSPGFVGGYVHALSPALQGVVRANVRSLKSLAAWIRLIHTMLRKRLMAARPMPPTGCFEGFRFLHHLHWNKINLSNRRLFSIDLGGAPLDLWEARKVPKIDFPYVEALVICAHVSYIWMWFSQFFMVIFRYFSSHMQFLRWRSYGYHSRRRHSRAWIS